MVVPRPNSRCAAELPEREISFARVFSIVERKISHSASVSGNSSAARARSIAGTPKKLLPQSLPDHGTSHPLSQDSLHDIFPFCLLIENIPFFTSEHFACPFTFVMQKLPSARPDSDSSSSNHRSRLSNSDNHSRKCFL